MELRRVFHLDRRTAEDVVIGTMPAGKVTAPKAEAQRQRSLRERLRKNSVT
jgi:hypothetical protein